MRKVKGWSTYTSAGSVRTTRKITRLTVYHLPETACTTFPHPDELASFRMNIPGGGKRREQHPTVKQLRSALFKEVMKPGEGRRLRDSPKKPRPPIFPLPRSPSSGSFLPAARRQPRVSAVGKELGGESLPLPRGLSSLPRAEQGGEVPGVVAVPFCEMFPRDRACALPA